MGHGRKNNRARGNDLPAGRTAGGFPGILFIFVLFWSLLAAWPALRGLTGIWGLTTPYVSPAVWLAPWALITLAAALALFGQHGWAERDIRILPAAWSSGRPLSRLLNNMVWAIAAAVLIALGWALRSRNYFMGDGWAQIDNVVKPFYLHPNEPLDFFIHQLINHLFSFLGLFSNNSAASYYVPAILLLPLFVYLCWKIAVRVTPDKPDRPAIFLILFSTTQAQLFFGHVESYTLVNLFLALMLYSGINCLSAKEAKAPLLLTLLSLLAVATHLSAVVILPAVAYAWLQYLWPGKDSSPGGRNSLLVLAASVLGLAAGLLFFNPPGLTPLSPMRISNEVPFSLFNFKFLSFKLNMLFFIVPAFFFSLPAVAPRLKAWIGIPRPALVFLALTAAGCLFFSLDFNSMLGIRDWDILSLPALPLAVLGAWSTLLLWPRSEARSIYLALVGCVSLLHVLSLVAVNSSLDSGVKFLDRITVHEIYRGANTVQFGVMLKNKGYLNEAMDQFRLTESGSWKARNTLNVGSLFVDMGKPDSAVACLMTLPPADMLDEKAVSLTCVELSAAYDVAGRPDSAFVYMLRFLDLEVKLSPLTDIWWLRHLREVAAARNYSARLVKYPPDPDILLFYARLYSLARDESNLKKVMIIALNGEFDKADWLNILEFTRRLTSQDLLDMMLDKACRQFPELRENPPVLSGNEFQ